MFSLDKFELYFNIVQDEVHSNACEHGWWDEDRSPAECIALMHSELSELLEEYRKPITGESSSKIDGYSAKTEELADLVIRAMDFAKHEGLNLGGAIVAKNEYNKKRPYKHGKEF